jgi:hypothetical protein
LYGLRAEAKRDANGNLHVRSILISKHRTGNKTIHSGFFAQTDAEYVSAVLFTNAGTISKFARMGQQGTFAEPDVTMLHAGKCYNHDPNASEPTPFIYRVGTRSTSETWGEGVTIFHNPRAKHPLSHDVFHEVCQQYSDGSNIVEKMPAFHPYRSVTQIIEAVASGTSV